MSNYWKLSIMQLFHDRQHKRLNILHYIHWLIVCLKCSGKCFMHIQVDQLYTFMAVLTMTSWRGFPPLYRWIVVLIFLHRKLVPFKVELYIYICITGNYISWQLIFITLKHPPVYSNHDIYNLRQQIRKTSYHAKQLKRL